MAEIRDANEVYAEQVAGFREAVQQALATTNAQQSQAREFVSGLEVVGGAVVVIKPGPADAPSN